MQLLEKETIAAVSPDDCAREILEVVPLVMRTIRSQMRSHRTPDLSVPQFRALSFLSRHEGASLSDVAEHIGLALPSMSKLIDGLVARHLVTRQAHPADRRRLILTLTEPGQAHLSAARAATLAQMVKLVSDLTPEQRATVEQAMRALRPIFTPARTVENKLITSALRRDFVG